MNRARELLLGMQTLDGGWPASVGGPSTTEATALAALALMGGDPVGVPQRERALEWLRSRQHDDGSWVAADGVPLGGWMTSLATLALSDSPTDRQRALRGAHWLLSQEGRGYSWLTKIIFRLLPERDVIDLNPDLNGWAWFGGTFSWVEPTSYALIALKSLRNLLPPEPAATRIREGERMILDRACRGGGWNYGNSRVFDEDLWPYPDTTAVALIALGDRPDAPKVSAGLSALNRMLKTESSLLATALGALCLDTFGQDSSRLRQRISDHLEQGPGWADTRALALAGLALEDRHPFEFVHD